jgi:hypothetical protein
MQQFVDNLTRVKEVTKGWVKSFNKKSQVLLLQTKKNINHVLVEKPPDSLFDKDKASLKSLLDLDRTFWPKRSHLGISRVECYGLQKEITTRSFFINSLVREKN